MIFILLVCGWMSWIYSVTKVIRCTNSFFPLSSPVVCSPSWVRVLVLVSLVFVVSLLQDLSIRLWEHVISLLISASAWALWAAARVNERGRDTRTERETEMVFLLLGEAVLWNDVRSEPKSQTLQEQKLVSASDHSYHHHPHPGGLPPLPQVMPPHQIWAQSDHRHPHLHDEDQRCL